MYQDAPTEPGRRVRPIASQPPDDRHEHGLSTPGQLDSSSTRATGEGTAFEQLSRTLDAYLAWIEANIVAWSKLVQSAAALPEARELVEGFREGTMDMALARLTGDEQPRPALRTAIRGWLGFMDAALLDWTQTKDLSREQLRDLLLAAFGAALLAAQQIDPQIELRLTG